MKKLMRESGPLLKTKSYKQDLRVGMELPVQKQSRGYSFAEVQVSVLIEQQKGK